MSQRRGKALSFCVALILSAMSCRGAHAEAYVHVQHFLIPESVEVCGAAAWRGLMSAQGFTDFRTQPYFGSVYGDIAPRAGDVRIVYAKVEGLTVRVDCVAQSGGRTHLTVLIAGDREGFGYWPRFAVAAILEKLPIAGKAAPPPAKSAPDPATPPEPEAEMTTPDGLMLDRDGGLVIPW